MKKRSKLLPFHPTSLPQQIGIYDFCNQLAGRGEEVGGGGGHYRRGAAFFSSFFCREELFTDGNKSVWCLISGAVLQMAPTGKTDLAHRVL